MVMQPGARFAAVMSLVAAVEVGLPVGILPVFPVLGHTVSWSRARCHPWLRGWMVRGAAVPVRAWGGRIPA